VWCVYSVAAPITGRCNQATCNGGGWLAFRPTADANLEVDTIAREPLLWNGGLIVGQSSVRICTCPKSTRVQNRLCNAWLAPDEVKHLAEIASEKHNGDFVTTLSKYCKGLDTLQQAEALLGRLVLHMLIRSLAPSSSGLSN